MIVLNLSWILLYLLPVRKNRDLDFFPNISVILPAHNEGDSISDSIKNAFASDYPGGREIIVVNDGSQDKTGEIARDVAATNSQIKVIDIPHSGKAQAINVGASHASGEVVVVLDADSNLEKSALIEIIKPFSDERMGAVSGIIRAEMNLNPLTWFQDIEYMMSSTWRAVCNKINGTYLMPGFTAFRKKTLMNIGGFERDTLCEDFDIGVRIKKAGYKMTMSNATMYTHVPQTIPALVRQRLRWSRGTLQVVKKHSDVPFNFKYGAMGLYGIPTQMYWFLHGLISLPLTAYQLGFGYLTYFVQYHDYFSMNVAAYFFNWFSFYGMVDYSIKSFTGVYPMNLVFIFCFASFTLGTLYTFLAIFRHSTLDIRHLLAVFFFFPYSFFALAVFMTPLLYELNPLTWGKAGRNIWTK
jgi:cellulose synthase/poly-beta-1,6-N-acetylglucosamine synthase-like glycosyltransferase